MGNYTDFLINDVEVYSTKWGYQPSLLLIFSEADRHERSSGDEEWGLYYQTTAEIARDRLDVLGYSLNASRQVFYKQKANIAKDLAELERGNSDDPRLELLIEADLEWERRTSFESWVEDARKWIYSNSMGEHAHRPLGPSTLGVEEIRAIAGFPGNDVLAFLRAILEVCSPESVVTYDLGSLVDEGYIGIDDGPASDAMFELGAAYVPGGKIIVLTEGSIDAHVLGRSMRLLFPHLVDYFSFMDFEGMKVPGGAGSVLGFLKAFVAAGVGNRILAILDNDTAATDAMRSVAGLKFPATVNVVQYPQIELAKSYPTIGPTGIFNVDINGLAGSIELYFGEDVLRQSNGELVAVQWRGYNEKLRQYQGEVMYKGKVQERFFEMLERCERDPALIVSYDWSGIRSILNVLRTSYQIEA